MSVKNRERGRSRPKRKRCDLTKFKITNPFHARDQNPGFSILAFFSFFPSPSLFLCLFHSVLSPLASTMSAQSQPKQLKKLSRDEVAKVSIPLNPWLHLLSIGFMLLSSAIEGCLLSDPISHLLTHTIQSQSPLSSHSTAQQEGRLLDHHWRWSLRCLQVRWDAPWRWICLLRRRCELNSFIMYHTTSTGLVLRTRHKMLTNSYLTGWLSLLSGSRRCHRIFLVSSTHHSWVTVIEGGMTIGYRKGQVEFEKENSQ